MDDDDSYCYLIHFIHFVHFVQLFLVEAIQIIIYIS